MLIFSIGIFLPHFFTTNELRQGVVLNDRLLQILPARNCSLIIFCLVWSTTLLIIVRSIQQPSIFLMAIYLLILLNVSRILAITLFHLDPPTGLIPLTDPLTGLFYGGPNVLITKDLFFSGHTSNLFLIYLCLQKKKDRQFAFLATAIVALLVLVQHVHYSIDVIGAFIFTYCLFQITKNSDFLKYDQSS